MPRPSRLHLALGYATIAVVWGSTYLGIRIALETLPPLAMAGVRFLAAGGLLALWAWREPAPPLTARDWRAAALLGALFLLGGNGLVVLAEREVPSALTAVLVSVGPFWAMLFEWWLLDAPRPGLVTVASLLGGLGGVGLLVGADPSSAAHVPLGGALLLLGSAASWSLGTVLTPTLRGAAPLARATALQMLFGGLFLFAAGLLRGEGPALLRLAPSARSVAALAYLIVFGSLVAFSTFGWLLRHMAPSRVATSAYVSPVVAVLLGWGFAGEAMGARQLVAAAVIVGSVVLYLTRRQRGTT